MKHKDLWLVNSAVTTFFFLCSFGLPLLHLRMTMISILIQLCAWCMIPPLFQNQSCLQCMSGRNVNDTKQILLVNACSKLLEVLLLKVKNVRIFDTSYTSGLVKIKCAGLRIWNFLSHCGPVSPKIQSVLDSVSFDLDIRLFLLLNF